VSPHPAISSSRHPALWPLAVLACLSAFVATHPIRPHDFWWHLKLGQEIVQTHRIPQVDTFSYTMPGAPYPSNNVYWLADVALYGVYALGGPALSVCAHTLLITGTFFLLFLLCRRLSGNSQIAAGAVLVAAVLGVDNYNVRPQAVVFPLFVSVLFLIHLFRNQARPARGWLLAFPAIMLLWTNCHGSSPLGLVLVGVWLVETIWERWRIGPRSQREIWVPAAALGLTAAAILANPMGVGLLGYLRAMNANPVVRHLPEWAPASLATKDGLAFFIAAPLGLALLLWAGRARSGLYHWLMLLGFALLALKTGRAIVWFGLALAPIIAELLPQVWPAGRAGCPERSRGAATPPRSDRAVVAAIMLCFVALMVVTLPWFKSHLPLPAKKAGLISAETPVAATDLIMRHCPPRLFHYAAYGSYLIWAAAPRVQVFVDPRIELYSPEVWTTYHALSRGDPGWQRTLDRYGVNTLLLDRAEQPGLIRAAGADPHWRLIYDDPVCVVFVRKEMIRQ